MNRNSKFIIELPNWSFVLLNLFCRCINTFYISHEINWSVNMYFFEMIKLVRWKWKSLTRMVQNLKVFLTELSQNSIAILKRGNHFSRPIDSSICDCASIPHVLFQNKERGSILRTFWYPFKVIQKVDNTVLDPFLVFGFIIAGPKKMFFPYLSVFLGDSSSTGVCLEQISIAGVFNKMLKGFAEIEMDNDGSFFSNIGLHPIEIMLRISHLKYMAFYILDALCMSGEWLSGQLVNCIYLKFS